MYMKNKRFILVSTFVLIWVSTTMQPVEAGPITGNYWFLGISNDEAINENDELFEGLSKTPPYKDASKDRVRLRDGLGGKDILAQLKFFHDNVKDGDTFIFYYSGHATNVITDNDNDDPGDDEGIGLVGDVVSDDQLASDPAFGSFPQSSTVIAIFNTCFAGGFIGGSNDIDRAAIKQKHNLLFMGSPSEIALCGREGLFFTGTLLDALEKGDSDGDKQVHAREWANKFREFWKIRQNLDLIVSDNLDDSHNRTVANIPEPSTLLLLVSGLAGILGFSQRSQGWAKAKKRQGSVSHFS